MTNYFCKLARYTKFIRQFPKSISNQTKIVLSSSTLFVFLDYKVSAKHSKTMYFFGLNNKHPNTNFHDKEYRRPCNK